MGAEPEAIAGADKRTLLKNLAKELKSTPPSTAHIGGNVKPEQLEAEVKDKFKEVQRQLGFVLNFADSSGWQVVKVIHGTTMKISAWNRRQDGKGLNGEDAPRGFLEAAGSVGEDRLTKKVEQLEKEIARLQFALQKAQARPEAGGEGGEEVGDAPPVGPDGFVQP